MSYWTDRYLSQEKILLDKTVEETNLHLARIYKKALRDNERDLKNLMNELKAQTAKGDITINDLYRYNRFWEVRSDINRRLMDLGHKQNDVLGKDLIDMYFNVQKYFNENPKFFAKSAKRGQITGLSMQPVDMNSPIVSEHAATIVNSVWCADGKYWSERTWQHMTELQTDIENGLLDTIVRGANPDELTKELMRDFSKSYHQANTLVRTELNHVYNQAAAERYQSAGCQFYEILSHQSDDECLEYNGMSFRFDEMIEGENAPPFHPNCRCVILPVIGR